MATPIPDNDATFTGDELTMATGGVWKPEPCTRTAGVAIDSRRVRNGGLFVAVRGERIDGHEYAAAAVANGACAVICERELTDIPSAKQLLVADSKRALGDLARYYRTRWGGSVFGITGSAGKTTSKELATVALKGRYPAIAATSGNLNNLFGLPMTILALPADTDCAVLEMGTSERGEIARLAEIAAPNVGLVTLVSAAHTLGLGSVEAIREEKASLFGKLTSHGVAVANADDADLLEIARKHHDGVMLTFGYSESATVRILGYSLESDLRTRIKLQVQGEPRPRSITVSLLGEPAAINAAAVVAAGLAFGIDPGDVAQRLEDCPPVPGRLFPVKAGSRVILDDSYNAAQSRVLSDSYVHGQSHRTKARCRARRYEGVSDESLQAHRRSRRSSAPETDGVRPGWTGDGKGGGRHGAEREWASPSP